MAQIKDQMKYGIDTAADAAKTATDRAANAANGTGATTFEAVKDTARSVATHVADTATAVGETAAKVAETGYDAAKDAGHKVEGWAEDAYKATAEGAGQFGKEATAFVRKYPLQALALGLGIGFLLGRAAKSV